MLAALYGGNMEQQLAKIIMWGFANGIEVTVRCHKEAGLKDQIEIELKKNGKTSLVRIYDWEDLGHNAVKLMVERQALDLCLTRLVI